MRMEEYCSETHGGRGKGQVSLWLNSSGCFPVIGNTAINIMILTETRTALALDFGGQKEARLCKVISSEEAAMFAPEALERKLMGQGLNPISQQH